MKVLKRRFRMTKEEVEENTRLLPFHRSYIETAAQIVAIRSDSTIASVEKLRRIKELRDNIEKLWKEFNAV